MWHEKKFRFDLALTIHAPENCHVKFSTHTIASTFYSRISSPPLQFAWTWDPITLPLTSLNNPQHLDHMLNELKNQIYKNQINVTNQQIVESVLTFRFNKTSIIIWLTLALTSTLYMILFIIFYTVSYTTSKCKHFVTHSKPWSKPPLWTTPYQPLPIPHQNQSLLQDLGNVIIRHHTTQHNPNQIFFDTLENKWKKFF
jgi:hypothetical protein